MPAQSEKQRVAMAIAEHEPNKLYERNKSLLSMAKSKLHEFATKHAKSKALKGYKEKRTDGHKAGSMTYLGRK